VVKRALLLVAVLGVGCRDLKVPEAPPAPGPGTISGRAVVAVAGRSEKKPAEGAFVRLLPTGLVTKTDADGLFVLEGVTRSTGELLLQHDVDGDGHFERQRLVRVDGYRPGFNRHVQLGDVFLEENATVRGRVLRGDVTTLSGHAGSLVFIPEGPFTATTSDDGRFVIEDMPPGTARLAFFRNGYESKGYEEISLTSGQELLMRDVTLTPLEPGALPGKLEGKVVATPATSLTPVRVEVVGSDGVVRVAAVEESGDFRLANLASDLYRVKVELAGYRSASLTNVLVSAGQTTNLGVLNLSQGTVVVFPDAGNGGGAGGGSGGGAGGGSGGGAGGGSGGGTGGGSGGGTGGGSGGGTGGGSGGETDAGTDAGSDAGIDAGVIDAGPDPRTPTAVLAGVLAVAPGQTNVTLSGSGSSDPNGSPLVYHWTQTQGPSVALSVNDALTPTTKFTAPGTATLLRFELTVTNTQGFTSLPAIGFVTVQAQPLARILPASLSIRTGLTADLDGTTSDDPGGGGLTYQWSVLSGPVTLEAISDAGLTGKVRLRAGATPGPAEVQLVVSNSLGLQSAPVVLMVTVNTDPIVLKVDAGAAQFVGFGKAVTLRATASSNAPADSHIFTWSQVLIDGGTNLADAGVQLSSSSGAAVSFTSPIFPTDLYFRVNASGTPSGATAVAGAKVGVIDDAPPVLVDSDPPVSAAGIPNGPWLVLSATFDEPLDVSTVIPANFSLKEADAGVAVDTTWDAPTRTVSIAPRRPLNPGSSAVLTLSGVADGSPQRNVMPTISLPFSVRQVTSKKWITAALSTAEIRPVPLIGSSEAWVGYFLPNAGCGAASSANFIPVNATAFGSPTSVGCGCGRNEQRNHAVVGGRGYYRCNEYVVYRPGNSWTTYPGSNSPPNAINTDGVSIGGSSETYGMLWTNLLPTGWAGYAMVDNTASYFNAGYEPYAFGGAVQGNRNLSLGVLTSRALRVFEQVGSGAWTNLSEAAPAAGTFMPRGAYVGVRPVVCHTHQPSTQLLLRCIVRNGSGWDAYEDVGQGTVERTFDVQARGDTVFVTYARAGKIRVRMLDTTAAVPAFVDLPGAAGATEWNSDPSCTARNPSMQVTEDGVWVAFQETCTSSWSAVLRKAE
jgi:hypothetical protein